MNKPEKSELVFKALRGEMSAAEERQFWAELEADPGLRAAYEEERALAGLLDRLPDAPISTNFTALVMQAARRSEAIAGSGPGWFRLRWVRLAGMAGAAGALALAATLAIQQDRRAEQAEMAETVGAFAEVASVMASGETPPEILLQDFDAIQRLMLPAESELDLELLVAMQR